MPKIKAPRTDEGKGKQTNVVLPPKLIELLKHYAAWHGRTLAKEIEAASQVHVVRSMLAALSYPGFAEEIREANDGDLNIEQFTAELEAQLVELEIDSVRRPADLERVVELHP